MSNERIENIIERSVINDKFYILGEHEGHYHMNVHNFDDGRLLKEKNTHVLDPTISVGILTFAGLAVSVYAASHLARHGSSHAGWVAFALGFYPTMGLLYAFASSPKFEPYYTEKNYELYKEFMFETISKEHEI